MVPNSSPISIGYFSPGWPLDAVPNGVVSYVADIASQLKKLGHQVTVVAVAVVRETPGTVVYSVQLAGRDRNLMRRALDGITYRIALSGP